MVKNHSDSEGGNPLPPHGLLIPINTGAGRNSEVERSLMVRWVVGSILHGGPIELLLVPASVPQLV